MPWNIYQLGVGVIKTPYQASVNKDAVINNGGVGALLLIGHWNYGWCLYQVGSGIPNGSNILCGSLLSGVSVAFNGSEVTVHTTNSAVVIGIVQ